VEHLTTYYWRVRANDGFEDSEWSSVQSFFVKLPTANVTVQTEMENGTVTIDGVDYISPHTEEWVVGSVPEIGTPSPQLIDGNSRHEFDHWSDAGEWFHNITVPPDDSTFTAYFRTEYRVIITNNPVEAGGGQVSLDDELYDVPYEVWFDEGTSHIIAALDSVDDGAGTRWIWTSWSDRRPRRHTIVIDSAFTDTAYFDIQYYLEIADDGHGSPEGEGWYDVGAEATFSIDSLTPPSEGAPYHFLSLTLSGPGSSTCENNPAT